MNSSPSSGVRQTRASACHEYPGSAPVPINTADANRCGWAAARAQAPRSAEVVRDQVHPVDPERGDRPGDELGVRVDGLHEARRRHARPRSPARPTRRSHAAGARGGDQWLPVGARTRVAVQEHDRLAVVGRPCLEQRRHDVDSTRSAVDCAVPGRGPRSTRTASRGRNRDDGRSCIVTTRVKAPAAMASCAPYGMQAAQVGVDGADGRRPRRANLGQREVGAGGEPPCVVGRPGVRPRRSAARGRAHPRARQPCERERLGGRDGDALAVERVERADRVADRQQAFREAVEPVVAPPAAGHEAVRGDSR